MQSKASFTDTETLRWPDWSGQTVVCIATGPSLTRSQVDTVRWKSCRVIGINDIGLHHDWIDIWYAADWLFWKNYSVQAAASKALKVCAQDSCLNKGFDGLYLNVDKKHLDRARRYETGYAITGGHSGFQALQLAISLGASTVVLLGYDCKARGRITNYFGTKCEALHKNSPYHQWPQAYRELSIPKGVTVLNATEDSAIDAYPFIDIGNI